jgi:hypothetical protein
MLRGLREAPDPDILAEIGVVGRAARAADPLIRRDSSLSSAATGCRALLRAGTQREVAKIVTHRARLFSWQLESPRDAGIVDDDPFSVNGDVGREGPIAGLVADHRVLPTGTHGRVALAVGMHAQCRH